MTERERGTEIKMQLEHVQKILIESIGLQKKYSSGEPLNKQQEYRESKECKI
jgi:hypothetical protein